MLVQKHYVHIIGDVSIDKSLYRFKLMKNEIGAQLSRMIAFYWRVYKREKERKRKAEEERKRKAKASKKKKKGTNRMNSYSVKNAPSRSSFTATKTSSMTAASGASSKAASPDKKAKAGDKKAAGGESPEDKEEKKEDGNDVDPNSPTLSEKLKNEEKLDAAVSHLGMLAIAKKANINLMQIVPEEENASGRESR